MAAEGEFPEAVGIGKGVCGGVGSWSVCSVRTWSVGNVRGTCPVPFACFHRPTAAVHIRFHRFCLSSGPVFLCHWSLLRDGRSTLQVLDIWKGFVVRRLRRVDRVNLAVNYVVTYGD